jgi:hypothetical protein
VRCRAAFRQNTIEYKGLGPGGDLDGRVMLEGRADRPAVLAPGLWARRNSKERRCSDPRNALPKGDPAALPKGDRTDVRVSSQAKGSNLAGTPMEMLAAPIGLFAPLQIGRCLVGRARTEGEPDLRDARPALTIADLQLLIAGQSKAT